MVWRHEEMSGEHVSNDAMLGDDIQAKDHNCLWSGSLSHGCCLLWRIITGVCLHCFLLATGRAVSKSRRPTLLLPEHAECLELTACIGITGRSIVQLHSHYACRHALTCFADRKSRMLTSLTQKPLLHLRLCWRSFLKSMSLSKK